MMAKCWDCADLGYYWTEGNPDQVADDPTIVMLECSEPFDGTICIRCETCKGVTDAG